MSNQDFPTSNLILFANNATSTLAAPITSTATTATLAPGTGALFPNPGANQYFVMTFSSAPTGLNPEIVWVTGLSGDTITSMARAQEGTTALAFSTGDYAQALITAGILATLQNAVVAAMPNTTAALNALMTAWMATLPTTTVGQSAGSWINTSGLLQQVQP